MQVLVVDDHGIVREGIRQVLSDEFPNVDVVEAATAAEALAAARAAAFDLIVLDLNLPDRGGVQVLEELGRIAPTTPVVVLTFHPEAQYAVQVLRAGGAAYVTKDSAPTELVAAVTKVLQGGWYVSPALAEALAAALARQGGRGGTVALSGREHEVLIRLGRGQTITTIARDLGLSDKTVSTYRARLLEKLGLATTADLIRYAVEHRLVG